MSDAARAGDAQAQEDRRSAWVHRAGRWSAVALLVVALYVLSSGPALAGVWALGERGWISGPAEPLAETVVYGYLPLVWCVDRFDPAERAMGVYIGWWCELFGTRIPG